MSSQARAQVCRIIPFAIDLCGRVKCFRFLENLQGVSVVCAESNATDVNVLVAHGDKAEVLLAGALTSGSEEGDCATVRGLGSNPPVVGVHFGIEDDVFWAFPHIYVRSGNIARPPVRTYGTPARLLQPSLATRVSAPRGHYP